MAKTCVLLYKGESKNITSKPLKEGIWTTDSFRINHYFSGALTIR
jgi:hypothetical protein